jgi:predicted acetyltransferase
MHLEQATLKAPPGLAALIQDLGNGENGFGGTPVARGEMDLDGFLQRCLDNADPGKVEPGFVPQTIFWVIDDDGQAVGMVRMRHYLNEKLRDHGGHIGYYIRKDRRGRGHARAALRLTLAEFIKLGEPRAMLTVNMDNLASIRVIEANGGVLESTGRETDGTEFGRYWIDLSGAPRRDAQTGTE